LIISVISHSFDFIFYFIKILKINYSFFKIIIFIEVFWILGPVWSLPS